MRALRAPLLVLLLMMISINTAHSQVATTTSPTQSKEIELLQWGVTQGGLVVVVLVVVWSYRRDFARVFDGERTKSAELMLALQASSSALTQHAEMLRDNANAMREQARAMTEMAGRIKGCELAQDVFAARSNE